MGMLLTMQRHLKPSFLIRISCCSIAAIVSCALSRGSCKYIQNASVLRWEKSVNIAVKSASWQENKKCINVCTM